MTIECSNHTNCNNGLQTMTSMRK